MLLGRSAAAVRAVQDRLLRGRDQQEAHEHQDHGLTGVEAEMHELLAMTPGTSTAAAGGIFRRGRRHLGAAAAAAGAARGRGPER